MAWATLVWGAGALGVPLRAETLEALDGWGLEDTASYEPLSLCNMAWCVYGIKDQDLGWSASKHCGWT